MTSLINQKVPLSLHQRATLKLRGIRKEVGLLTTKIIQKKRMNLKIMF